MNLKIDSLRHIPLTEETVQDMHDKRREYGSDAPNVIRALCLSHERLRAELHGAEILLAEVHPDFKKGGGT